MLRRSQLIRTLSRENNVRILKSLSLNSLSHNPNLGNVQGIEILNNLGNLRSPENKDSETSAPRPQQCFLGIIETTRLVHSIAYSENSINSDQDPSDQTAFFVQNLLKFRRDKPIQEIERALDHCRFELNDDLVLNVLRRHRSDWKPAYVFFNWISKVGIAGNGYTPGSEVVFRGMWDKGCKPDVVVCNCIIDALCFKKRIPQALQVFQEMNERGCPPNVATYNALIKHLCKIGRMEKVYELVDEMEDKQGNCLPNAITYSYLLSSSKDPEEVPKLLERMERHGCSLNDDIYNLILRLYMDWDIQDGVRKTWEEMERTGWGPDRPSYTIMIHGHYDKRRMKDASRYFREMTSKGMVPESRTEKLANSMNIHLKERAGKLEGTN